MRIFITGIGGTIGTAFVDYLNKDHHIVGIDRDETNVARIKKDYPNVDVSVGDFGDVTFVHGGIDLLIHLAAMKHIDLCEFNPSECVVNNVVKTQKLFKSAYENKVNILFMSTDKAVEPISTYGYTKALGESMAVDYGGSFIRSGNIIASSGSVINLWEEAIENNKPIKITHKDMRRYFITAENLVERVWDQYMDGVRVIIPKMDRDIYLIDLAKEVLSRYDYTIENYPPGIEYTGVRVGEKLAEKLYE